MTMTTEEQDRLRKALSVYVEGAPIAPEWLDWSIQRAVPDLPRRFVTGPVVAELVNDPHATPEIDFEGVESPGVAALRQSLSRRRWVPAVVAVGAAFAVLIAVGLPVLFFGGGESVVVVEPSTTVSPTVPATTVAPTATTAPATAVVPVVPATPMTWDRVVDLAVFGGDDGERMMMDVAIGDGVAVAVGFEKPGRGEGFDAAVWYSVDGATWNRVAHDDGVFGGDGHQRMNAVVALDSGFIAVGSDGDEPGDVPGSSWPSGSLSGSSQSHAAVWRSDNGVTWVRVPHSDALSATVGGVVMRDVAVDGSGLVAVGLAYQQTAPFATYRWGLEEPSAPTDVDVDFDAAVWRSPDGVAWSRVGTGDEAFGGDTVRQSMNAVALGGPGFVAVGQEGFDFLGFDEWTPIERKNTDGREHVMDNVAAVWTSPDGEAWTRVADAPSLAHSGNAVSGWAAMFDVVATGPGLVAVGWDVYVRGADAVAQGAAVWISSDGVSWQRADVEGALGWPDMHAVTATTDGSLVAGGGYAVYPQAATWVSRDDGDTWLRHPHDDNLFGGEPDSRADDESFGPASIQGISLYGSDVLAVGSFDGAAAVWVGSWNGGSGG